MDDWLAIFRRRRIGRRPTGFIVAYRGARDAEGMSWTPDLRIANEFARRNRAPLCRTTLRSSAIIAVIDTGGGWTEYVVDPARLGRLTEIELAPRRERTTGRQATERAPSSKRSAAPLRRHKPGETLLQRAAAQRMDERREERRRRVRGEILGSRPRYF